LGDELVECHSGYEYPDHPVALHWQGCRLEIEEIEAQWRLPEGKRFRVRTRDGQVFELFYHQVNDEWSIDA
jgi:hypothetical protein